MKKSLAEARKLRVDNKEMKELRGLKEQNEVVIEIRKYEKNKHGR